MLVIQLSGTTNQTITFQQNDKHYISFEHHTLASSVTISLRKSELPKPAWDLLCELAEKLKVLHGHAFVSDAIQGGNNSMLLNRFEDYLTFDFFSDGPESPTLCHHIYFQVPGESGNPKNSRHLPLDIGLTDFYVGLYSTLDEIVKLRREITIQR